MKMTWIAALIALLTLKAQFIYMLDVEQNADVFDNDIRINELLPKRDVKLISISELSNDDNAQIRINILNNNNKASNNDASINNIDVPPMVASKWSTPWENWFDELRMSLSSKNSSK